MQMLFEEPLARANSDDPGFREEYVFRDDPDSTTDVDRVLSGHDSNATAILVNGAFD